MPLHVFVSGESANVAENLDANFQFLLGLIQGTAGGSQATAIGTSTCTGLAQPLTGTLGTAVGTSIAQAFNGALVQNPAIGQATGSSTSNVVGAANVLSPGTAVGGPAVAIAFTGTTSPATAAATGTSATSFIGSGTARSQLGTTGLATVLGISAQQIASQGNTAGLSSANGVGQGGASESPDNTFLTQPSQTIFASNSPGQTSVSLSSFTLSANPGVVVVNGVNDSTTSNVVELWYNLHVLHRENVDGTWFRWSGPGTWVPEANPLPQFIAESVEGLSVASTSVTMYSSATPGQAAPTGASVANGQLQTWTLSAVPGLVVHNNVQDPTTTNTTQLYYHVHTVWKQNSSSQWATWSGTSWTNQATGPVPNAPTINVAQIPSQVNTNTTIQVTGTYQDFTGAGVPTLQYADNPTISSQNTTFDPNNKAGTITLSNANETAASTGAGTVQSVRSTTSYSTGKIIFEATIGAITSNWEFGFANAGFPMTGVSLGDSNGGIGFQPNFGGGSQAIVYNAAIASSLAAGAANSANGDRVTICCDFTNKLFWVTSAAMRTAGFAWNNSNSANPATGSGGISFSAATGPFFIVFNEFDSGGSVTLNTLGPFAVATPAGFAAWDVTSSGSTTWLALPNTTGVTSSAFSFIHPPITTQSASYTIGVRDANSTGVIGVSNAFQVQTPGILTLNPMTLDNTTFQANQAPGAHVGFLTIPVSGGSFTGTVSCSNSNFTVTGTGSPREVVTTAVLGAGNFTNVVFTAHQSGAVNDGETLTVSLTAQAEAATATVITATGGNPIVGSSTPGTAGSQLSWNLIVGGKISLNGVSQTLLSNVTELYYINHTLYIQQTVSGVVSWQFYNGTVISGGQLAASNLTSSSTPVPSIALNTTSFPPNTNGNTGITSTLVSAGSGLGGVTWTEDSASFQFQNGNQLWTVGTLPAGSYSINITATIS